MSLAVRLRVADAVCVRWPCLGVLVLALALLAAPASADDGVYAQFLFGAGDLGGALESRMGGAGRLRVVSGKRDGRWANEEAFTWDGGKSDGAERHDIVSYGFAKKRFLKMNDLLHLYVRGAFGVALLDGQQVGPSVGLATGVQLRAPIQKYSLTLSVVIETGVETAYLMPAEIDASFAYYISGFSVGTDFDF